MAGRARGAAAIPSQPRIAPALDGKVAPAFAAHARLSRKLRPGSPRALGPTFLATPGVESRGAVGLSRIHS